MTVTVVTPQTARLDLTRHLGEKAVYVCLSDHGHEPQQDVLDRRYHWTPPPLSMVTNFAS